MLQRVQYKTDRSFAEKYGKRMALLEIRLAVEQGMRILYCILAVFLKQSLAG